MKNQTMDTLEAVDIWEQEKREEIFENFKATGSLGFRDAMDKLHELAEIVEGLKEDVREKINNTLN